MNVPQLFEEAYDFHDAGYMGEISRLLVSRLACSAPPGQLLGCVDGCSSRYLDLRAWPSIQAGNAASAEPGLMRGLHQAQSIVCAKNRYVTWTISKDDWKASLKIVSKKCYGYGLGCSIDAKVKLGYYGESSTIPEDATIEVTYKIKGAKDGPVVGSTEVTNQTEYDVNTEYLDTRSGSSKLTVVVTYVEGY